MAQYLKFKHRALGSVTLRMERIFEMPEPDNSLRYYGEAVDEFGGGLGKLYLLRPGNIIGQPIEVCPHPTRAECDCDSVNGD